MTALPGTVNALVTLLALAPLGVWAQPLQNNMAVATPMTFALLGFAMAAMCGVCICVRITQRQPGERNNPLRDALLEAPPITRINIAHDDDPTRWRCSVCEFCNATGTRSCMLCGTNQTFLLAGNSNDVHDLKAAAQMTPKAMANDPDVTAVRRFEMLDSRQRGARHRLVWVRTKRGWQQRRVMEPIRELKLCRDVRIQIDADDHKNDSDHPQEDAFVSVRVCRATHIHGRECKIIAKDVRRVDAFEPTYASEITDEFRDTLQRVAKQSFQDKYRWLVYQTSAILRPWQKNSIQIRVNRETVLAESIEQILGVDISELLLPLRIEFIGEVAVDAGGLEREWFAIVTEQLFDESVGVFRRAQVGALSYVLEESSAEVPDNRVLYLRGAGRLLGRAILEGQLLKAHLAIPLLKHLLGAPLAFSDVEFFDEAVYRSLKWLREHDGVDALGLDFSVTHRLRNGETATVDLKENGRNIDVTDANKDEYIALRVKHLLLDSHAEQLQHLLAGVFEVVPQRLLLVFDHQELDLVLSGAPLIDVADWKENTRVSDDLPDDLLGWFWEIVEALTDDERSRLLQFATGTSRVPVQGFRALTSHDGRIAPFTLKAVPFPENEYIHAHTCFNRLDVPLFPSKQELEQVLTGILAMDATGFTDQ